jgi:peroxiredoxin
MIRIPAAAITLGAILAVLAGCSGQKGGSSANAASTTKPVSERKKAADFELRDTDGRVARLSDYKGKVVLVNFWATWCVPCRVEIPWFIEFEKTYKDRGFAVIGVATDEDGWKEVKPYIQEKGINYRVVLSTAETEQAYGGIDSLPMSFVIDKEGRTASVHIGLVSKADYENEIKELLR